MTGWAALRTRSVGRNRRGSILVLALAPEGRAGAGHRWSERVRKNRFPVTDARALEESGRRTSPRRQTLYGKRPQQTPGPRDHRWTSTFTWRPRLLPSFCARGCPANATAPCRAAARRRACRPDLGIDGNSAFGMRAVHDLGGLLLRPFHRPGRTGSACGATWTRWATCPADRKDRRQRRTGGRDTIEPRSCPGFWRASPAAELHPEDVSRRRRGSNWPERLGPGPALASQLDLLKSIPSPSMRFSTRARPSRKLGRASSPFPSPPSIFFGPVHRRRLLTIRVRRSAISG